MFESHGGRKVKVIESIGNQWGELAKALGFENEVIDYIADMFPQDHEASCQMLSKWLDGGDNLAHPITWTTLIQCLIDAGFVELAESIRDTLYSYS